MARHGELLVAIMNNLLDMAIAREQHWYRIPVSSVRRWLKDRWPPQWLAFYQTKIFGDEAYSVRYYARVLTIQPAYRHELFPDQPRDERSLRRYHQLFLEPLQRLPEPIWSRRRRRIVFIPTTWEKFISAVEINDLSDESPLEDRLWALLQRWRIPAERQEWVQIAQNFYALDFAIYCTAGKIDVETDGDTWHSDPARIPLDNLRDNVLETVGWRVLRFNTPQIQEQGEQYCLPTVVENINRLGGTEEGQLVGRRFDVEAPGGYQQLLLDDLLDDDH
jgi:very-short-patch-repair endonuclease